MAFSLSQQLRDLLQRVEESEEELLEGRLQIKLLKKELVHTRQQAEYWRKQAMAKQIDEIPKVIIGDFDGAFESRTSTTAPSISSHRSFTNDLHEAIDELYSLPGDLSTVLVMMDNIMKCHKYYQTLWLDATCEVSQSFGHWTKLRLQAKKLQGDRAVAWFDGQKWAPNTKEDLKVFTNILVELQEEFEALCNEEQLSPYSNLRQH